MYHSSPPDFVEYNFFMPNLSTLPEVGGGVEGGGEEGGGDPDDDNA